MSLGSLGGRKSRDISERKAKKRLLVGEEGAYGQKDQLVEPAEDVHWKRKKGEVTSGEKVGSSTEARDRDAELAKKEKKKHLFSCGGSVAGWGIWGEEIQTDGKKAEG